MDFIQKIKDSPYYSRIKDSLEYRHERQRFLIYGGIFAAILAIFVLLRATGEAVDADMVIYLFFGLILGGFWLYTGYQWLELFLHMDRYIFFQARLDQPHVHSGRYGASISFTVNFTNRSGKTLTRETAALFSSNRTPFLEDYNNKIVQLAYNEETDRLVVLRRIDA
jgi:hypothetical protein